MSLCSICPEPGRCCKKFCLPAAPTFWKSSWEEDAQHWVEQQGVPFAPHSHGPVHVDEESGEEFVLVWFHCPEVTAEGRCGIYENRPDTCRIFVPGSDQLCAFHKDAHLPFIEPVTDWEGDAA